MLDNKAKGYRGDGSGFSWPNAQSGTGTVKAVFGPRPFSPHIATVGYDYDFHRGVDFVIADGSPVYAPVSGAIMRQHYTHFGWEVDRHLDRWELTDPSSSLTVARSGSDLVLTCARVGAVSFPSNVDRYYPTRERITPEAANWVFEVKFASAPSISSGAIGIGVFAPDLGQYIALEYDGTTFTTKAVGTATFTADGGTVSASGKTWMRIERVHGSDQVKWSYSTDGDSWTTINTENGRAFTSTVPNFIPTIYWRSGDTNATPFSVTVDQINWYDENESIGRFGNWLQIGTPSSKVVMHHFQSFVKFLGDFVSAGELIGYAGKTGFDARSGRITAGHAHLEYAANNKYIYDADEQVNVLDKGFLPRTNVDNNVSVVRTSANDPDAVDSHKLAITVTRQSEDFDLNEVTLTGNTTSRTVNWNTRSGLNADNDIPKQSGVYIVPQSFDENSASYQVDFYFNKSVVGSTFSSYVIKDTSGTTVASG